jgi:hypothetical protein
MPVANSWESLAYIHWWGCIAAPSDLFAPCTLPLPGLLVRHYAGGLVGHDRGFLHERP